jgi:hypothetical protein
LEIQWCELTQLLQFAQIGDDTLARTFDGAICFHFHAHWKAPQA